MSIAGIYLKIQQIRGYLESRATELPVDVKDTLIAELLRIENELSYYL